MAKLLRDSKVDIKTIINRLEKKKRITGGKVQYEEWFFEDWVSLLETCIEFSKPTPETTRRRIILESLFSEAATKPLSTDVIFAEINKREAAYIKQSPVRYLFATFISLPQSLKLPQLKFGAGTIKFYKSLPKKVMREHLANRLKRNSHDPNPPRYTTVVVTVDSRSIPEAVEISLEELDFVRGVWNFSNNFGFRELFSSGLVRSVNRIRLGQVHTLHDKTGKPVDPIYGSYWYDRSYVHEDNPGSVLSRWKTITAMEKTIRRLLAMSHYPHDLRTAFVRYGRALDQQEFESGFVKLWSLLEFLTDCGEARYDKLVHRCTFLFKDTEFHKQVLEHLRQRRNLFVHYATESDLAKSLVVQLKYYAEKMIMFHLNNGRRFQCREDAASLLDLPYDSDKLRERVKRDRLGLRWRRSLTPK